MKLTKRLVEELQPDDDKAAVAEGRAKLRDIIAWDSEVPGFGVKVTPAGTRVYFVYYSEKTSAVLAAMLQNESQPAGN